MSDHLGTIPYPQAQDEQPANPLDKYHKQLDPLGKVTDQLFQPIRSQQVAPINQYAAQMMTDIGQRGITPSVQTPPETPMPLPQAQPPSAMLAAQGGPQGAPQPPPGPMPAPPQAAPAAGGPADVTQFSQDPQTGGLRAGPVGARARMLASMAPEVPSASGPGSQALEQAGSPDQGTEPPDQGTEPGGAPMPEDVPSQSQSDKRISTRIPSEAQQAKAGVNAHETADLPIDHDSMKRAPEAYEKNAQIIKEHYPGFEHLRTNNPEKITEAFIQHLTDNLKWLYGKMNDEKGPIGPSIVERAKRWYSGANKIAHDLAREFNVKPYQAAAVLAALSPQKDWYQNVHLARKVFEAHQLGHNWRLTPEMDDFAGKYIAKQHAEFDKLERKDGKTRNRDALDHLEELRGKFRETPMAALTDPYERAVFARWHDEAHNPRSYQMVTPEGDQNAGTSMIPAKYYTKGKRKGQLEEASRPRDVTWGSFNEIQKGMAALQNASLPEVSRLMGGAHKVRNFFNNIIAPLHGHDVTIDTHAIAAALLRPLGAGAMEVAHGLGTNPKQPKDKSLPRLPQAANSAGLGNKGMYGLYAEAYRRAAKDLNILPRELQSVTWEGIRGLFSPEQKRNPTFVNKVADMWRNRGEYRGKTPDERREAIMAHAGGLKLPSWAGGIDYGDDAEEE